MKTSDVIIIGAGAAGLFAAYTLVKAGKTVTVLEARNRLGGRIHTVKSTGFPGHVELGAEFVHGNLPVTLNLLDEAGIAYTPVSFEMWHHRADSFNQDNVFVDRFDELLEKINALATDMPLYDFLQEHFSGAQYNKMRAEVENYVAGYDTADIHDVSAFALRNEWNHEDEDAQHRLVTGYSSMIDYLAKICTDAGSEIVLNTPAREVIWDANHVSVVTADGLVYEAAKMIIALPLGVLQSEAGTEGAINFSPAIPQQQSAIRDMGFGALIKIVLEFKTPFWEEVQGGDLSTMGFLFTDEVVPTYWTQAPDHSPVLTGWLGGPPALAKKDATDEDILQEVLTALGNVFSMSQAALSEMLTAWHVANWTAEQYTRGSYAYDTVASPEARKALLQPVQNTLYFAGEYLYDGPAMGTVEAALTSGRTAARQILSTNG